MLKMEGVQKIYRTDLDQKRKQRQSEASRCAVAVAVDVQPLAAPAGVARAVGQSAMDGRLSFAATGMPRRSDPEHVSPDGDPFVAPRRTGADSGPAFFAYGSMQEQRK
ncbi:hypothetical protein [Hydrocarboniphaga effusa]|uniref:hypothetical protein n=1 Tax=Hydrocarboniphaga effusa TaxID=243629 RepID=UPI0012FA24F1|nr:hypothetical protein [Hydrocarboniphaga effusa]